MTLSTLSSWQWIGATPGRRRAACALLLVGLVAIAGAVHAVGMYQWPAPFDDEGTYVAQAWTVQHWGSLAHYTYWYDHPPFGWLTIAGWTSITDAFGRLPDSVAVGRELMLVVQLIAAPLVYVLARRLKLSVGASALALLLFSLSPLALLWHRLALLDNLAVVWVLASFVLAAAPKRHLLAAAGSGVALAAAVLTKETFLLFAPGVGYLMWITYKGPTRRYALTAAASLFAMCVAFYPLLALLKGELVPGVGHVSLIEGIQFQLFGRKGSGSIFDSHSLARQVVNGWLSLDKIVPLLGIAMLPLVLRRRETRAIGIVLVIGLVMILRPGYLPSGHVTGFIPFLALSSAAGIESFARATLRVGARLRAQLRDHAGRLGEVGPLRLQPGSAGFASSEVLGVSLVVVTLTCGLGLTAGVWAARYEEAVGGHQATGYIDYTGARAWMIDNLPRNSRILIGDEYWVDLVEVGFHPANAVWFYKLDLDPEVQRRFPRGWRDMDYVVSSEGMRATVAEAPSTKQAIANSRVVRTFGTGSQRVEIRRILRSPMQTATATRQG